VRSLVLKAAATALTLAAAGAAAVHVGAHVKDSPASPLHPGVMGGSVVATASGGKLSLTPSVRSGGVRPVTSTYVS
jgi:hypothetical protein